MKWSNGFVLEEPVDSYVSVELLREAIQQLKLGPLSQYGQPPMYSFFISRSLEGELVSWAKKEEE